MSLATVIVAVGVLAIGWAVLALPALLVLRARTLDRVVRKTILAYLLVAGGWGTVGTLPSVAGAIAYRGLLIAFVDSVGFFPAAVIAASEMRR